MVEPGIGRLLVASLHQGIADVSPARLDFYEDWLSPTGLRDGRIGLAPLGAVLSFLHREPPPADDEIPARAGSYAAAWALGERSATRQALTVRLPLALRARIALRLGRALVHDTIPGSRVHTKWRRGQAVVEIRSPLFDQLREPSTTPMRRFYAAAYGECLRACGVEGVVAIQDLASACRMSVAVQGPRAVATSAVLDLR